MTDLPTAAVIRLVVVDGTWQILARCPSGRLVHHGGGPADGPPVLGARVAHCRFLPQRRTDPVCEHGDYELAQTEAAP